MSERPTGGESSRDGDGRNGTDADPDDPAGPDADPAVHSEDESGRDSEDGSGQAPGDGSRRDSEDESGQDPGDGSGRSPDDGRGDPPASGTERGDPPGDGDGGDGRDEGGLGSGDGGTGTPTGGPTDAALPPDVRKYERFTKMDGAEYDRVNEFLRDRTYVTAREWAIARLCADFRTETGVEMTKIGENLPELVPFMTDTYTPQAVNQARASFEEKVRTAGATFLYGAMCGFFTAEELDEVMYEVTETAKFLLEVEGVDLAVEEELDAERRVSEVMREVREASEELRAAETDGTDEADETDAGTADAD